MPASNVIISQSNVAFGTSGARGLVEDFTHEVCAAFTSAFLEILNGKFDFQCVAIAIDNRPSSYSMAQFCISALTALKVDYIYLGVIPTPALAYHCLREKIPGIMVTGSHIPFDRNGLKFYSPDGEITKQDELSILSTDKFFTLNGSLSELIPNDVAKLAYIERYTSLYQNDFLLGKRIGIYEHSSAGRDVYKFIFSSLGAKVISLGRSDNFIPIDTEAVSQEDQEKAIAWSKKYSLDAIFSTDGDGDRPLMSDENGKWLRGDILGLLCANALKLSAVAVPVSCNTVIERSGFFNKVVRTKIGSPYVISCFENLSQQYTTYAGFEANGGFILGSDINAFENKLMALPTRDAVLPALMLLFLAGSAPISTEVNKLPQRFTHSDRLQNFPTTRSLEIIHSAVHSPETFLKDLSVEHFTFNNLDLTDGFRVTSTDGDVLHFRPSGNAPELRCYSEAGNELRARYLVAQALCSFSSLK